MNATITRNMIGAELLRLRRNRGVMAFALFLTVGITILYFGIGAIEHSSNPTSNGPIGGMRGFRDGLRALGLFFGTLAAILIGGEAGTSDRSSGVFRDLVVTGRSRLALFAVRLPAAFIMTLAVTGVAYALALIGVFVFAGGTPTPSLGLILQGAGWLALAEPRGRHVRRRGRFAERIAGGDADRGHRLGRDRHQHPAQRLVPGLIA